MKRVCESLVCVGTAILLAGCSGGTASDNAQVTLPPVSESSDPSNLTAAERQMVETMSSGGIADPDMGI